jgi:hypothetical protein
MTGMEYNLCHKGGNGGLTPDYYRATGDVRPRTRDGVESAGSYQLGIGYYFTCADRADGIHCFPCTGSKHIEGFEIRCTCSCHKPTVRTGLLVEQEQL